MYRRSTKQKVALIALIAAAATVITLDFRNPGGSLRVAEEMAVSAVAALQDGISRVFRPVGDFLSGLGELAGLRAENEELQQRVAELEARQGRLPEIIRENERLKALIGTEDWASGEKVTSRVIGVGPSNSEWTVFIDKGSQDGVAEDMAVVAAEGLVGRVVLVAPRYSKVLLIVDTDHSVGVRLTESGETGALGGRGAADLRFELIDPETDVEVGETVVTSGYDRGIFPGGIPVGRTASVEDSPSGLEKTADVSPFVDFGGLDFVQVLLETGRRVGSEG
jgi:rod shape-determining protein MreC